MPYNSFRLSCVVLLLQLTSCQHSPRTSASKYIQIQPAYNNIGISATRDTISFQLDENTYNKIKTFNVFSHNKESYIAFYDKRSASVNIFNIHTRQQTNRIVLKHIFSKYESKKISPFVRNFDSIFINTSRALVLIDSTGKKLRSIDFLKKPKYAWAEFENTTPPLIKDHHLYASVSPYVNETSISAIKKWRVMYDFDLLEGKATLIYPLPVSYTHKLYGYHFFNHSYCINDQGRFVFSFPVDSCIYETDFNDYHNAYLGKSHSDSGSQAGTAAKSDRAFKQQLKFFLTSDTYSSIYYDPFKKRYLRLMYSGISETDYDAKNTTRQLQLIIFDQHFKIIGESNIQPGLSLSSIFFADGNIYARAHVKGVNALHFVRLAYSDENIPASTLGQLK